MQIGRILSPAELPVGAHTLDVTITDPLEGVLSTGITFHIDAIGTGACG